MEAANGSEKAVEAAGQESMTLADQAYDRIADAIVRGELPAGSKITEKGLRERFGIGRGPLREALRRLEGRRLVVAKARSSVRVASLSHRDIVELYEIRQALEGLACMLATERMTDLELDQLEALLEAHEKDPLLGRGHSRSSPQPDFHFAIAHGSRNVQLIELLCGQMFDLMRVYRYKSSGAPGRTQLAFNEHREIVAAMRQRDADRASMLMQRHVRQSKLNLMREQQSSGVEMLDLNLGAQNSLALRGLTQG